MIYVKIYSLCKSKNVNYFDYLYFISLSFFNLLLILFYFANNYDKKVLPQNINLLIIFSIVMKLSLNSF
jgi:hypothetical protein